MQTKRPWKNERTMPTERSFEMKDQFEQYIANLKKANQLIKFRVSPGMTDEDILAKVQEGADALRLIGQENNALLQKLLFSKTPESLSAKEVSEFSELADGLFHYARSMDVGISLCIHRLLYAYAKLHEDRDMMIRELYYQGLAAFYLNLKISSMGINVFREEINGYFSQGASYFSQWEDITSEESRGYIIRCMANRNLTIPRELEADGLAEGQLPETVYEEYMRNFDETMQLVTSPYYRSQNPDIPWDSFIYSMHYDRITFLSYLRRKPNLRIDQGVMESAAYVYRHQESAADGQKQPVTDARTIYIYAAARFHSGIISARELMDILLSVYQQADDRDFSMKGIQFNLMYPQYLHTYFMYLSPAEKPLYHPQVQEALQNLYSYLLRMPRNEYINKVASSLRDVMRSLPDLELSANYHLLDMILACHAPTYIHSIMVAWLNERIVTQLLDTHPEVLEGVFGYSGIDSILANREQIRSRAYSCGLYHDLGKSMVINYIGIYGRRLLDEEFLCIQYHSRLGADLLKEFPGLEDLAEVALHHHRSYDARGGYPRLNRQCSDRIREIAYITSVSDSIDAATDGIGRSYVTAKPYETLVKELFERSGRSYAPEIVALFKDQDFSRKLGRDMAEFRKKVYCKVYRELAEQP